MINTFNAPEVRDLRNFMFMTWDFLGLPAPTPVQYDIANVLQNVLAPLTGGEVSDSFKNNYPHLWDDEADAPVKRIIVSAFRGIGKSWETGVAVPWALAQNPDLNIMVVSGSARKATEFSTFAKRLITEMPELKPLMFDPKKEQRWSNEQFDVGPAAISQAGSVRSGSITGTLTGGRADIIIADDVETPNTSETQGARDKLASRVTEFDAILKPGGVVIYLGTPQIEDTVYTRLEQRGYRRMVWPARYPGSRWMTAHGYALAPSIARALEASPSLSTGGGMAGDLGHPVDTRFSEDDLQEREASFGRSGFALQFMLDTALSDREKHPLRLSDLIVDDIDLDVASPRLLWSSDPDTRIKDLPVVGFRGDCFRRPSARTGDPQPYQGSIMFVDPAGRGKDEMAYAVVKQLNGFLYATEVRGILGEGYSDGALRALANAAKRNACTTILVESNFGDGMFTALLKPVLARVYPCSVEEVRHSQQKERRIIETLEPVMNQHRLVIDRSVIRNDLVPHEGESREMSQRRGLFYQMTRITPDRGCLRHDDRLDALAGAVSFWVEASAQDAERNQERDEAAARHAFLKRQVESRFGLVRSRRGQRRGPAGPGLSIL